MGGGGGAAECGGRGQGGGCKVQGPGEGGGSSESVCVGRSWGGRVALG